MILTVPPEAAPSAADLATLREQLRRQAFLYEDPRSYLAGVEDTLAALRRLREGTQTPHLVKARMI